MLPHRSLDAAPRQLLLLAGLLPLAAPHSTYLELIPNGVRVAHPDEPGRLWKAVGHIWPLPPRSSATYVPFARNPFGLDFARNSFRWTQALCEKDSDGDGLSNGEELGDPHCVWQVGLTPTRTTNITHPGVLARSTRPLESVQMQLSSITSGQTIPICERVPQTDLPLSRASYGIPPPQTTYGGVCYGSLMCNGDNQGRVLPEMFPPTGLPMKCPGFVGPWILFPLLALLGICIYRRCPWLPQARWLLVWFLAEYGGCVGVDVVAHRYFSHGAYECGPIGKTVMALHFAATIQGNGQRWAFMHRIHHKFCDQELDPTTPEYPAMHAAEMGDSGFIFSHVSWLWTERNKVDERTTQEEILASTPAANRDEVNQFSSDDMIKSYALIALCLALYSQRRTPCRLRCQRTTIAFFYYFGVYICLPLFIIWNGTMATNSATHLWGSAPFRDGMTDDFSCHSKNTPWLFLLLLGGNWHNNHHAVPSSASTWVRWWEIDMSYLAIRMFELLGLAYNVRLDVPHDWEPNARPEEEPWEVFCMAAQLIGLAVGVYYYMKMPSRHASPATDNYSKASVGVEMVEEVASLTKTDPCSPPESPPPP